MNKQPPLTSFGQWQLVRSLGSGAFGEVYHFKNLETGYEVAIKRLKANPKLKPDEINILHKRWLQEYKWMQNLRTNCIVGAVQINDTQFLNYLSDHNSIELSLPAIIMDFCNGGDLRSHLNKINNLNGLTEFEVKNILYALLRATEYLHHECNIEHRDIKPENIVLHIKGNEKIYKLTDFGYAREIPENTIAQSVVGTRNYVAPEVIDPGVYTKSVDYWSIGVLAFEIICGIHPFIPHETFVNRMKNIQQKPTTCIHIIQNVDLTLIEFKFVDNILPKNNMSCIFIKQMENWLRLALDINYKTRGFNNNNVLKFYTELDVALEKKIVTVFSLKTLQKYCYDIESCENLQQFHNKICFDNDIDIKNIFFIFPPLHPKKQVQTPMDYYVPEWCDTTNHDNPPVMLFVTEFLIKSCCDLDIEKYFLITDAVRKCMSIGADNDNIPLWLLKQFEGDVHFFLNEHQQRLECYLMGLHKFAIEIEHEVFKFKNFIDTLSQKILQLTGGVKHAKIVLNECLSIQKEQFRTSAKAAADIFTRQSKEWEIKTVPELKVTYKEILQECQKLATNDVYERYSKKDIYGLSKYRKFLDLDYTNAVRLENAQNAFDKCIKEFKKFIQNTNTIRSCILEQLEKFCNLRQNISKIEELSVPFEKDLENFTRTLVRSVINEKLSLSMNSLHIDGPISSNMTNSYCSSNDFDMDSKLLIDECQTLCNAMTMSLDMD